jgi:hypothetical protein
MCNLVERLSQFDIDPWLAAGHPLPGRQMIDYRGYFYGKKKQKPQMGMPICGFSSRSRFRLKTQRCYRLSEQQVFAAFLAVGPQHALT